MTDQGPRMANLLIEGILPDDVTTESHQVFWRSLLFKEYFEKGTSLNGKTLTLPLRNSFAFDIKGKLSWNLAPNSNWTIKPAQTEIVLQPQEEKTLRFMIYRAKPDKKLRKAQARHPLQRRRQETRSRYASGDSLGKIEGKLSHRNGHLNKMKIVPIIAGNGSEPLNRSNSTSNKLYKN
jgi:hypothetical protein